MLDIIYEDADLLVVNKPANWFAIRPKETASFSSLISRVRLYLGFSRSSGESFGPGDQRRDSGCQEFRRSRGVGKALGVPQRPKGNTWPSFTV